MFDQETRLLLGLAVVSSYGLSHVYRKIAVRAELLAEVNDRSAHHVAIPTGCGIVLCAVFMFCLLLSWARGAIADEVILACMGPLVVGITGYADDRQELSIRVRLPVYVMMAIWSVFWVGFPVLNLHGIVFEAGFSGLVFGVVALLWLQNLFNFMDGIDGIAASEVVFVCISASLIAVWVGAPGLMYPWMMVSLLAASVALGYLVINWPRATLFMGDAGSNFFGLMLGILVLGSGFVHVWTWMILLCQFVVDACLTICLRAYARRRLHESHSQHAYQHLNRRFGSAGTLLVTILINVGWLLPLAVAAERFPKFGLILLLLAALPILLKDWLAGAGADSPRVSFLRVD